MTVTKQKQTQSMENRFVVTSGKPVGEEQDRGRILRGTTTVFEINETQGLMYCMGNAANI